MSVTLNDVRGASNPLRNYNFELIIPALPVTGNGDVLRLLVVETSSPGFSVETFESGHYGFIIKHAGRGQFPRTLNVTYEEDNKLTVHKIMRLWRELCFNSITGHQLNAKVIATLKLLDLERQTISQIQYNGLFLESVPDVPLSGGAPGAAVQIPVTFSYDTHFLIP